MAASLSHDQLVAAFESRFDYATARTMINEVFDRAGIAKSTSYDGATVAKIVADVEKSVSRPQNIVVRLSAAASAPAAPAPAPKAAEAKPVAAAEPAAEAAPAAEAPAAGDAPADDGGDKPAAEPAAEKKGKKKEG